MPAFDPPDPDAVLADLTRPGSTLVDIARAHRTSLPSLADWMLRPDIRDRLDRVLAAANLHLRIAAAPHLPRTLDTISASLDALSADLAVLPPEARASRAIHLRRGATLLLRLASALTSSCSPRTPPRPRDPAPPAPTPTPPVPSGPPPPVTPPITPPVTPPDTPPSPVAPPPPITPTLSAARTTDTDAFENQAEPSGARAAPPHHAGTSQATRPAPLGMFSAPPAPQLPTDLPSILAALTLLQTTSAPARSPTAQLALAARSPPANPLASAEPRKP